MVGAECGDGLADERVVGLGRDHALPGHVLARWQLRLRHLRPEELPVLVEAVHPPAQPTGPRLEHADPEPRVPLEHAVEDQSGEGEHLLHRVRRRVPAAPRAEPVRPRCRDDRAGALVEDHRDVEVDHVGEEAVVIRVRHRPALHRVRAQHDRLHPVVGDRAADLGRRRHRVVQGGQRDGHEAAIAVCAQRHDPAVVGPGEADGELGREVVGPRDVEPVAREERGHVDPLDVHAFEQGRRVEAAAGEIAEPVFHHRGPHLAPVLGRRRQVDQRTAVRHRQRLLPRPDDDPVAQ